MATADEYASWIVKNADKKGTPDFDVVAKAYADARKTATPESVIDPSSGGSTLQVLNPFGKNFDTGIDIGETATRTLAGAGKAFSDAGRGIGQYLGLTSRADVAESRKRDEPLMKTTAGTVGNVLGNVAMLAPTAMIPGANTITGAGAIGGVAGLLQPSTSTGETVGNALMGAAGGAGGQAAINGITRVAGRAGNMLTQGQQQAAQGGQRLGMRLTPGKASGSTTLQKMEAALESNPMTAGGFDAIKGGNWTAVNRAAAQSIGETADELSTPILARAEHRIGQVFDQVADPTPVRLDPVTVGGRLRAIAQDSEGMMMGNANLGQNGLWTRLDNFVNSAGGATREQLRQLSSNMGKAARANMTTQNGDRALGEALFAGQEVVEDAIQGTLNQAEQQAYAQARQQYRNLMLLTAKTNVVNPSSGNVSGRALANTLMQKDRGGFTMGRNATDMYDAARFTQAFPSIVGDSGTATRSMGAADYLTGLPGNLLTRMYLSAPVAAAANAGAGAAGTAARLANNPLMRLLAQPIGTTGTLQAGQQFRK
jgi:hypothetical protein